ncbi:protein MTSS 1-like [Discoglossus pictus]
MDAGMEKECSALGGLFQTIMSDMKASYPTWEDFINKAIKLQSQLKTTTIVTGSFLDAFQKIADMAINTRGATKEIGSALTRMCMRHRNIESRLKHLTVALTDSLINPLEIKIEEWKKVANQLDKDHAKEYKKARADIKKKSSDTIKLQKKVKKGKDDARMQLDSVLQDVNDKYMLLEETEKRAVYRALVEERGRFCMFVSFLKPVLDEEIGMLGEITHLQTILEDLTNLTTEPNKLPPMSEQVILDLKNSDYNFIYQTPPSSPSGTLSRKASTNRYNVYCFFCRVADYDYISLHGEQEEPDQLEFDKSSTIPRNSDISQNYRRMFQAKRPASTVSLLADPDPLIRSPYVATIKRKPSNKPTIRRGTISGAPIPIRPPVVPIKATNFQDVPISPYGERTNSEEFAYFQDARSDLSQMKQGLCTSAQSLNAIQTTYCAFIPKQSYTYSHPQPSSPQKLYASGASIADSRPASQPAVPKVEHNMRSLENTVSIADTDPPPEDMLSMIKRGVKLRKTISNDRSAPQIK